MNKKIDIAEGKKETVYAFAYSLASKAVTYIVLLVFANLYLAEEYGAGSFAFNIRNIVTIVAFIGIPDALIPFIVKKKKIGAILKTLILINLAVLLAGIVIAFREPWIWPLVLTYPLVMLNSVGMAFWRAKSRYDIPYKAGFYSIILTLVAAYLLSGYGRVGVLGAYAAGNLISFIWTVYPIRGEIIGGFSGKLNFDEAKNYLKVAMVVVIIGSLFVINGWVNSTLLGIFGTYEQVADFGVSSSLAGIISIIPLSLSMFILTRASQIRSKIKSKAVLYRTVRISFFLSLLAAIALTTIIPTILHVFFPKYIGSAIYVFVFNIGMVFYASYNVIYSYYIGKTNPGKALVPVILGLIINLGLAVGLLMEGYGVLGVAIASSVANFAILLFLSMQESIKKIVLMSFFAVAAIALSYYSGYFGAAVFVLTIPLSFALGIITLEDFGIIRNVLRKIVYGN